MVSEIMQTETVIEKRAEICYVGINCIKLNNFYVRFIIIADQLYFRPEININQTLCWYPSDLPFLTLIRSLFILSLHVYTCTLGSQV